MKPFVGAKVYGYYKDGTVHHWYTVLELRGEDMLIRLSWPGFKDEEQVMNKSGFLSGTWHERLDRKSVIRQLYEL